MSSNATHDFILGQLPAALKGVAVIDARNSTAEEQLLIRNMENMGFRAKGNEVIVVAEAFSHAFWRITKLGIALMRKLSMPDNQATWDRIHVMAVSLTVAKAVLMDQVSGEKLAGGACCGALISALGASKLPPNYHPVLASLYHLVGDTLEKSAFGFARYFSICVQCQMAANNDVVGYAIKLLETAPNALGTYLRSTTKDRRTTIEKQANTVLQFPRYQSPDEQQFLKQLASSEPGHPEGAGSTRSEMS